MASILCCCANGSGTSLMMAMTLEKVIKAQGCTKITKTHHCSLSEGKNTSMNYDIVMCPQNFTNMFEEAAKKGVTIIGLRNVMSAKEMTEKLENCGVELK